MSPEGDIIKEFQHRGHSFPNPHDLQRDADEFIAGALHPFNGKSFDTGREFAVLLAIAACMACYLPAL